MIRKLFPLISVLGAIGLAGCSGSEESLLGPLAPETAPIETAQSTATVGLLGARLAAGGAVLLVPPSAFPVGTEVVLSVTLSGTETFYSVDFGGASSLLPAVLTINSFAGHTVLFADTEHGWIELGVRLNGVFTQPLSVACSFKTSDDVYE